MICIIIDQTVYRELYSIFVFKFSEIIFFIKRFHNHKIMFWIFFFETHYNAFICVFPT